MNWAEMKARWDDRKMMVAAFWPQLSRDELHGIDGDRSRLCTVLQSRYGLSADAAERAVCTFEKDIRLPGAAK